MKTNCPTIFGIDGNPMECIDMKKLILMLMLLMETLMECIDGNTHTHAHAPPMTITHL
jgi:hypothetical protein